MPLAFPHFYPMQQPGEATSLDCKLCEALHGACLTGAKASSSANEATPIEYTVLLPASVCRSPEEALVHAIVEARRASPAILYLPHLQA